MADETRFGPSHESPLPKARPALAWVVIVILASVMIVENNWPGDASSPAEMHIDPATEMTAKLVVACADRFPDLREALLWQANQFKSGGPIQQMTYAVLLAELKGPDEAAKFLEDLQTATATAPDATSKWEPTARETIEILQRRYSSLAAGVEPALTQDEGQLLKDRLGWVGELAPFTKGTGDQAARRRVLQMVDMIPLIIGAVGVWYVTAAVAGFVGLVILLVLTITRRAKHGFHAGSGRGGFYIEMFAVWLTAFFVLRLISGFVAVTQYAIAVSLVIVIVATALAIVWPSIRGLPWRVTRRDLGLFLPSKWAVEFPLGLAAYAMALPFMALGIIAMVGLAKIQEKLIPGAPPPSHPAQEILIGANWTTIIQVLIYGAIVAPIVEEIMFRGALYRHLRESSERWGMVLSMIFSAALSSFLFAVIHPQGIVFTPILMGLAVGFCVTREWRGTLVPCMIAHGTTNFVTLWLNILLNQ